MRINIPLLQKIVYRPGLMETVKFAWVQYVMVLLPVLLVFNEILKFLFKYRIFEAVLVSDLKLKRKVF